MRKLFSVAVVLMLMFSATSLMAQTKLKIGHINYSELLQAMPGVDSLKAKMETYTKTLESQLKTMQSEFDQKYQEFGSKQSQYTDLIKQTKQKELTDLQSRIQEFQQTAQEELQKKQQELLSPMIEKAKKAIEDVSKENGYTYVFDTSQNIGVVLYSEKSDDITALVKKKVGIIK